MYWPEWRNGRRAGFKIQSGQPGVGSTPTSGTSEIARTYVDEATASRGSGNDCYPPFTHHNLSQTWSKHQGLVGNQPFTHQPLFFAPSPADPPGKWWVVGG